MLGRRKCKYNVCGAFLYRNHLGRLLDSTHTGRRMGFVDFITSKDCPVSAMLTDDDKASLLRMKQDAIKKLGG